MNNYEGQVISETAVIVDDVLLLITCLTVSYVGVMMSMLASLNMTIEQWRSWEIGGFDERLIVADPSSIKPGTN